MTLRNWWSWLCAALGMVRIDEMRLPDSDRSRAVLIGASRFIDPELPDLPAARNNVMISRPCLQILNGQGCSLNTVR